MRYEFSKVNNICCTCLIRYGYFAQVKDVVYEVIEGDPRNVLPEAVEKYHADMLVVGSHGYGAIKRYTSTYSFEF